MIGASATDLAETSFDEETRQFILETHMENLGLFDFLGFELASLASAYSEYSNVPNAAAGGLGSYDKLGEIGALITLVKSFIGIGVLTLPYAIGRGGYVGGPLALTVIAGLAYHCMGLLLKTASTSGCKVVSFGALGKQVCGPWAKQVVEYSLISTQFGFCIAYVIFIVENVCDVVCYETKNIVCPLKYKTCIVLMVFLLPFSWLKSLHVLAVPTLMSNFVLLGGICWVYYCAFLDIGTHGMAKDILAFNWEEFPVFFGMAVFTFEGIGLVLPIQHVMAKPAALPKLLRIAMGFLAILFASFGTLCFITYGLGTRSMITFNIPQNKITSFLRLFYCLGICFTYPVMMFPLYQLSEAKYKCIKGARKGKRRYIFRALVVLSTGLVGLQIPHFGLFLGIIGSVACSLLAFVLPALFHLRRIDRSDASRLGDAKDMGLIAFGVVGGGVSFVMTMKELVTAIAGQHGG